MKQGHSKLKQKSKAQQKSMRFLNGYAQFNPEFEDAVSEEAEELESPASGAEIDLEEVPIESGIFDEDERIGNFENLSTPIDFSDACFTGNGLDGLKLDLGGWSLLAVYPEHVGNHWACRPMHEHWWLRSNTGHDHAPALYWQEAMESIGNWFESSHQSFLASGRIEDYLKFRRPCDRRVPTVCVAVQKDVASELQLDAPQLSSLKNRIALLWEDQVLPLGEFFTKKSQSDWVLHQMNALESPLWSNTIEAHNFMARRQMLPRGKDPNDTPRRIGYLCEKAGVTDETFYERIMPKFVESMERFS